MAVYGPGAVAEALQSATGTYQICLELGSLRRRPSRVRSEMQALARRRALGSERPSRSDDLTKSPMQLSLTSLKTMIFSMTISLISRMTSLEMMATVASRIDRHWPTAQQPPAMFAFESTAPGCVHVESEDLADVPWKLLPVRNIALSSMMMACSS